MPALFGIPLNPDDDLRGSTSGTPACFVIPLLTFYFVWKRGWNFVSALWLALPFAAGAVFANIYPFQTRGDTEFLTALHLPIALWLAVGFAYVRGRRFADGGRMNFVRFSGEWVIYYVLIALGGGVLTSFTFMMFRAIDMNPAWFVAGWLLPCGGGGGRHHCILAGGGEAKCHRKHGAGADPAVHPAVHSSSTGVSGHDGVDRQPHQREAGGTDRLRSSAGAGRWAGALRRLRTRPADTARLLRRPATAAVVSALVVDGVALAAIAARISEFGFTPNRVAALGENLILLINLAWSAWLYASCVAGARLPSWNDGRLSMPVYSIWAALVVIMFPPVFGYRSCTLAGTAPADSPD